MATSPCVQLRMPDVDDGVLVRAVETLMPICRERDVAFLVNGHIDVVAGLDVDGVHIGRAEGVAEARRRLGDGAIVGVSCGGSRDAAMRAGEAGCDYVSFGALFASTTLPDAEIVATDVVALVERPDGSALRRGRRTDAGELRGGDGGGR